jgi:hypothetical protein
MEQYEAERRFEEIRAEIYELMNEALDLYADHGGMRERGKGYWYAHVMGALGGEYNSFLGGSFISMEDAQQEMAEREDEEY